MPTLKELSPPLWFVLHTFAGSYPHNPTLSDQNSAINFFNSLINLLPCKMCANHLKEYLKYNPLENFVQSKDLFEKWVFDYHENVNDLTKVPHEKRHTLEEVKNAFIPGPWKEFSGYPFANQEEKIKENNIQENDSSWNTSLIWIIIIVSIIIIFVIFIAILFFSFSKNKK